MERRRCLHEREPDAEAAWARSSPQADDLVVEERGWYRPWPGRRREGSSRSSLPGRALDDCGL